MVRLLLAFAAALAAPAAQALEDPFPKAAAAYLVLRDGKPLWGARVERRLQPASLAKMMTALLVLEQAALDETAIVGKAAAAATGKRIGLKEGDRLRLGDLLAATVIGSANDACRALAEHAGKSLERFVEGMNARARALGLWNTRFADPCGHDRPGQYTTVADLALLAQALAARPDYLALSQVKRASIRSLEGREFTFSNTNALIGRYPGAIGLKSGYTGEAGKCLAALVERDGTRVLIVMLDGSDRWWDAVAILERAFSAAPR